MKEYTINDILQLFLRQWKLFVVGVLVCGILSFSYTMFFIPETYQSRGMVYVNNKDSGGNSNFNSGANLNDLYAAERLSESFRIILKTEKFLSYVIEDTGLDITPGRLKSMISVSIIENTEILEVRVTGLDPALTNTVAASVLYNAQTRLASILDVGHIEIIEDASFNANPIGPNKKVNTLVGMVLGAILVAAFVVLREVTNTTISSELDIENFFDIPVIGLIPDLHEATFDDENNYTAVYK